MGPAAESRGDAPKGLEIEQDLRFLSREARVQRIAWAAMLVVVGVAFAGGFGRGPLASTHARPSSETEAVDKRPLEVRHDRVARHEAEMLFEVRIPDGPASPTTTTTTTTTISMDEELTERLRIERVVPEPERVRLAAGRVHYDVAAAPGAFVRFDVKAEKTGITKGRVAIGEREAMVKVFVLP